VDQGDDVTARVTGAGLALLTVVLGSLLVVLQLDSSFGSHPLPGKIPDLLTALAFALVGAVLTAKRAGNFVGWALLLAGVALLLEGTLISYGQLSLLAKPEAGLPAGAVVGALATAVWTAIMFAVFLLLVLFPEGRFRSPRWRRLTWLVFGGFALVCFWVTTAPGNLDPALELGKRPNPLGIAHPDVVWIVVLATMVGCLVAVVVAAIDLVLRFRRSRGQERQQFKWLAASAALLVAGLPLAAVFNFSGFGDVLFAAAMAALPISVGVAVLCYRLYDIDVIIRRTLVYGVLTAGLAVCYLGTVLVLQHVFASVAGGSNLAIAGSTLVVAALARPARSRVQTAVDHRFYRRKYDAERTLLAFSAHLRDEIELDALRRELTSVVAETMQPAHVSQWVRGS
jgi:hypothetical protein